MQSRGAAATMRAGDAPWGAGRGSTSSPLREPNLQDTVWAGKTAKVQEFESPQISLQPSRHLASDDGPFSRSITLGFHVFDVNWFDSVGRLEAKDSGIEIQF
jgi:hypothetical protein